MSSRPYLSQIDALRGIAAIVVACFYHIRVVYSQTGGLTPLSNLQPFYWLQFHGYLFVDLFFVISGVVFAYNYLVDGKMRQNVTFIKFFQARIARLYPLHLFTLLVVAGLTLQNPTNSIETFVAHLFFLNVFAPNPTQTFNGPAWSLSVEMLCYSIFALAALWGRVGIVALACILAGVVFAIDPSASAWDKKGLIVRGLFGFFVGYSVYRFAINKDLPTRLIILCIPLALVPFWLDGLPKALAFSALVWPITILLALRLPLLNHQFLRWIGERSYSIYLVHWPIFIFLAGLLAYYEISPGWWAQLVAAAIVLLASNLTYRAIELPSKRLLKRTFGIERPKDHN